MLLHSRLQTLNYLVQHETPFSKVRKLYNKSNQNYKLLQKTAYFPQQEQNTELFVRWNTFMEKYEQNGEFDENQIYYIIQFLETELLFYPLIPLQELQLLMQFLQHRSLFQIHLNGFNAHVVTSLVFKKLRSLDLLRWCPTLLQHFSFENSTFSIHSSSHQSEFDLQSILQWMQSDCNQTEVIHSEFLKKKENFLFISDRRALTQKIKKRDQNVEEEHQISGKSGFQMYKDLEQTKNQLLGPKYKGPSIFEIAFDLTIPIEKKPRMFQVVKPHEAWSLAERRIIHAIWEEVHIRKRAFELALKCIKWSPICDSIDITASSLLQRKLEISLQRGHMFHVWKCIDFCCSKQWIQTIDESLLQHCFVKLLEHVTCVYSAKEKVCFERGIHMLRYMERVVHLKPQQKHYTILLQTAIQKENNLSICNTLLEEINAKQVEWNEEIQLFVCKWYLQTRQWKKLKELLTTKSKKFIYEILSQCTLPLKKGFVICMEQLHKLIQTSEMKHDETSLYYELLYSLYIVKHVPQAHCLLQQIQQIPQTNHQVISTLVEAYHALIEYYLEKEDDYGKAKQLFDQMTQSSPKTYQLFIRYLTSENVNVSLQQCLLFVEPLLSWQQLQQKENLFQHSIKTVLSIQSLNCLLKKSITLQDKQATEKILQWIINHKEWLLPNAETISLCVQLREVRLVCEFSKWLFKAKQVIIPSSKVQRFYHHSNDSWKEEWKVVQACDADIDERIEENWEKVKLATSWKYKSKKTKATELMHFENFLKEQNFIK